jgi:hypothetical protein
MNKINAERGKIGGVIVVRTEVNISVLWGKVMLNGYRTKI